MDSSLLEDEATPACTSFLAFYSKRDFLVLVTGRMPVMKLGA